MTNVTVLSRSLINYQPYSYSVQHAYLRTCALLFASPALRRKEGCLSFPIFSLNYGEMESYSAARKYGDVLF